MRRSGLHELLVQTDNSGRHFPFFISLSTVHVYSGVALSPFDMHCDNQNLFIKFFIRPTLKAKKADIALSGGTVPQSYGTSLAIWDHTVLPTTLHK